MWEKIVVVLPSGRIFRRCSQDHVIPFPGQDHRRITLLQSEVLCPGIEYRTVMLNSYPGRGRIMGANLNGAGMIADIILDIDGFNHDGWASVSPE